MNMPPPSESTKQKHKQTTILVPGKLSSLITHHKILPNMKVDPQNEGKLILKKKKIRKTKQRKLFRTPLKMFLSLRLQVRLLLK